MSKYIYLIIYGNKDGVSRITSIIGDNDKDIGKYIKSNKNIMLNLADAYCNSSNDIEYYELGKKIKHTFYNPYGRINFNMNNPLHIKKVIDIFKKINDKDIVRNIFARLDIDYGMFVDIKKYSLSNILYTK